MIDLESRQVIADVAESILSARPLIDVLDQPVLVDAGDPALDPLPALNLVARRLGTPSFARAAAEGPERFHRVVSDRLGVPEVAGVLSRIPADATVDVDAQTEATATDDFERFCETTVVVAPDGTPFTAYAAGDRGSSAVVLYPPCGMPARLVEPWLRHFAQRHRVITWVSRGMFHDVDAFDGPTDVDAQVGDAIAVLEELDVRDAHVAGLCGGAVGAVRLAGAATDRVRSLSLWHGDFHLGDDAAKTDHQRNLLGLMATATESTATAASIHAVVCESMLGTVPADLAAQVLYPYASAELFERYCHLNGAIMQYDIRPHLAAVAQPTLVVTSKEDSTAHPDGSKEVSSQLANSTLVVNDTGDHITLFRGEASLLRLLDGFLDGE